MSSVTPIRADWCLAIVVITFLVLLHLEHIQMPFSFDGIRSSTSCEAAGR